MAQTGIHVKAFLGAFGMEFPEVIKELGQAGEGLFGTTAWQPGVRLGGVDQRESADFIEAFKKRFGSEPAPLTMHGYAAVRALLEAVEKAAGRGTSLTGEPLRDALARADVATPLGRIKFDERGDPIFYERVVIQIQGGRHVVVYPGERATAPTRYPAR